MTTKRAYKNALLVLINLVVFAALLSWLKGNVRPEELLKYVKALPTDTIVWGIAANIVAVVFAGFRLAVLVQRPRREGVQVVNLGFGFNAVLPLRMGELARLYYAKRLFDLSAKKHLAASLIEKYFDLSMISIFLLCLIAYGQTTLFDHNQALALFGAILVCGGGVLAVRRLSPQILRLTSRSPMLSALAAELRAHAKVHDLGRVTLFTIVIWVANIEVAYIAFSGFLPEANFSQIDAIILVLVTALAVAIPSAPSGIGIFEAGIVIYLTRTFHVENELALASAIVFHAMVTMPQVLVMIWVLLVRRKVSR